MIKNEHNSEAWLPTSCGPVIREVAPKARNACLVMTAVPRVELNRSIRFQKHHFRKIVGKKLREGDGVSQRASQPRKYNNACHGSDTTMLGT